MSQLIIDNDCLTNRPSVDTGANFYQNKDSSGLVPTLSTGDHDRRATFSSTYMYMDMVNNRFLINY